MLKPPPISSPSGDESNSKILRRPEETARSAITGAIAPENSRSRALALGAALVLWTACSETNEQGGVGAGFDTGNLGGGPPCVDDLGCDEVTVANGSGGGNCVGTASPCATYSGTEACGSVLGCTVVRECQGTEVACGAMTEAACSGQFGCLWQFVTDGADFCGGTASACNALSDVNCENQIGCKKVLTCTGTATACESITTQQDCQAQPGCRPP